MDKNIALYIAGIIFGIVALFHIYRLYTGLEVIVGPTVIPVWYSLIGLIITGGLSIWMFWVARN